MGRVERGTGNIDVAALQVVNNLSWYGSKLRTGEKSAIYLYLV